MRFSDHGLPQINKLIDPGKEVFTDDVEMEGDLAVAGDTALAGDVTSEGALTAAGKVSAGTGGYEKAGSYGQKTTIDLREIEVDIATCDGAGGRPTGVGTGLITIDDLIPAGAIVLAVTAFVDTILAGAGLTTWSIGITGTATLYGTTQALAAGTDVNSIADGTAAGKLPTSYAAATDVILTAAAGVFSTGKLHICIHYIQITPPTT